MLVEEEHWQTRSLQGGHRPSVCKTQKQRSTCKVQESKTRNELCACASASICETRILIEWEHFASVFHHWNCISGRFLYGQRESHCVCSVLVTNFLLQRAQMKVGSEVKYHRVNTVRPAPRRRVGFLFPPFPNYAFRVLFLPLNAGGMHMAQGAARPLPPFSSAVKLWLHHR